MKNKKGFTLVELLAVVAILAILVIIALPNVLKLYRKARKDSFLNEVKSMLTGAETAYVSESLKNNKINVVASDKALVDYANAIMQEGEPYKISGKMNYDSKNIDYYIELDNHGKPTKYIFSNGAFAVFSVKGKVELEEADVIEENIKVKDYINEFNIKGPNFDTYDTYLKDADMFNFRAEDLIKPDGTIANSWTTVAKDESGNDVQITGKIMNKNKQSVTPIIKNNAIVLPGATNKHGYNSTKIAIRFDKMPYKFKSFTLEGTIKLYEYGSGYTNIISNVDSGGYYLNVSASDKRASLGVCDAGKSQNSKCYVQCRSKQKLNLNENYVITGVYNDNTKRMALYINGKKVETETVHNDGTKATAADNVNNECVIKGNNTKDININYPNPLVPLTIGGNPSPTGFDDDEWFSGEVYLARIYNGALSPEEIENNYYSNMMTVKGYSQQANVVSLSGGGPSDLVKKYQISMDQGNTWKDYNPDDMPIIGQDSWVYGRTISVNGVISPTTKHYYDIEEE